MSELLTVTIRDSLQNHFDFACDEVPLQAPAPGHEADIASPIALQISKKLSKSPGEIAAVLQTDLKQLPEVSSVEVAGVGYLNVCYTPQVVWNNALAAIAKGVKQPTRINEPPVIVEYSQPNIAKPLGVHHLLSTVVGQAIANLYRYSGYNVVAWNYLGDYGTQFGKLAVAIEEFGDGRKTEEYSINDLFDYYVRFHEEVEHNSTLDDRAREAFKKLEDGDTELQAFWEKIVHTTKQSLQPLYSRLHVSFDTDKGESFYQDKMAAVLDEGKAAGVFTVGERGALIVDLDEENTNLPPYLVQKADGATLYSTRDIAQMQYRQTEFNPQKVLIITDVAQKLHFEQLEATCEKLGYLPEHFENILVGRMRFADKSMSTRKGNVLRLSELLDEAVTKATTAIKDHGDAVQTDDTKQLAEYMGIGAVSYGILSQNRKQDLVFDWDRFLALDGNSAPYLQYTYARAKSVLAKAECDSLFEIPTLDQLTPKERELLNTISRWPQIITQARESHLPHLLCTYLYSLCQVFNSFYSVEPILQAEESGRVLRLNLVYLTTTVLHSGAAILTISLPERM